MTGFRVFLSSTSKDLGKYRVAVIETIRRQDHQAVHMERWTAGDRTALEKSLSEVAACDLYVGIIARSYGSKPKAEKLSFTQLEYEKAVENGIPAIFFLLDGGVGLSVTPGERRLFVGDVAPGEPFGLCALLPDQTHTYTAQANKPSRVVSIDANELRSLCASDCSLGVRPIHPWGQTDFHPWGLHPWGQTDLEFSPLRPRASSSAMRSRLASDWVWSRAANRADRLGTLSGRERPRIGTSSARVDSVWCFAR
jgi:hypothetical protein